MRWLILAVLPLLVAGCATVDDPFLETGAIRPDAPAIATEVAPEFAAAYLPSISGGIESVRQTVRDDFLDQAIVYANATASVGENVLTVRVGKPSAGTAFLHAPTRRTILAEMRQALPGVAMTIDPAMGENVHGVYGYATGPLGATGSCLYAWQFAKRVSPLKDTALGRLEAGNYSAQVRLRFCHPTMPQDSIAVLMGGLRLKPVTRDTFALLQYAGGTGYARRAPQPVLAGQAVVARAAPAVAVGQEVRPRRTAKRRAVVVEEKPAEEPVVIRNAVRVPLPGETMEKKPVVPAENAVPAETAGKTAGAVLVPMPETAAN